MKQYLYQDYFQSDSVFKFLYQKGQNSIQKLVDFAFFKLSTVTTLLSCLTALIHLEYPSLLKFYHIGKVYMRC